MVSVGRSRTGRVLRVGQTGDRLIGVMLVIVIAAAIGFVGTDVTAEIDDSTDTLDGDSFTETNESVGTVTFSANNTFNYTVNNDPASSGVASVADDERVFNTTSSNELTENTDYWWFPNTGQLRINNTSAVGNNTADTVITYNWTESTNNFGDAQNNLSDGFTSAMSLTDVVFIVLMFSVILGALLAFRVRTG